MNLFTRDSPYYHLLKHLLFLLKHPVYFFQAVYFNQALNLLLFLKYSKFYSLSPVMGYVGLALWT
jgi:hypothetical protein